MSIGIAGAVKDCLERGERAVVVRVNAVRGSAPREAGTLMLVTEVSYFGTIGGGHLEWEAIALARKSLARVSPLPLPLTKSYALGPSLGQCCGGAVDVEYFLLTNASLALVQEHDAPLFRLQLFGAGHVGQALVSALAPVRCQITWVDEREDAFPSGVSNQVRVCSTDLPELEVKEAKAGDFFVVMTHRHDLDMRIVEQILRRQDAGFIGLIGSDTKRARFASQLAARGLSMDKVQCPLAQNSVTNSLPAAVRKEPGVLAIAIANELLGQAALAFNRSK
jgi:xanthine dehydrogenase accessory factor